MVHRITECILCEYYFLPYVKFSAGVEALEAIRGILKFDICFIVFQCVVHKHIFIKCVYFPVQLNLWQKSVSMYFPQ